MRHTEEVTGLIRPARINGCIPDEWQEALRKHTAEKPDCPVCTEWRAERNRKIREDVYNLLGLTKIKGGLNGIFPD